MSSPQNLNVISEWIRVTDFAKVAIYAGSKGNHRDAEILAQVALHFTYCPKTYPFPIKRIGELDQNHYQSMVEFVSYWTGLPMIYVWNPSQEADINSYLNRLIRVALNQ